MIFCVAPKVTDLECLSKTDLSFCAHCMPSTGELYVIVEHCHFGNLCSFYAPSKSDCVSVPLPCQKSQISIYPSPGELYIIVE